MYRPLETEATESPRPQEQSAHAVEVTAAGIPLGGLHAAPVALPAAPSRRISFDPRLRETVAITSVEADRASSADLGICLRYNASVWICLLGFIGIETYTRRQIAACRADPWRVACEEDLFSILGKILFSLGLLIAYVAYCREAIAGLHIMYNLRCSDDVAGTLQELQQAAPDVWLTALCFPTLGPCSFSAVQRFAFSSWSDSSDPIAPTLRAASAQGKLVKLRVQLKVDCGDAPTDEAYRAAIAQLYERHRHRDAGCRVVEGKAVAGLQAVLLVYPASGCPAWASAVCYALSWLTLTNWAYRAVLLRCCVEHTHVLHKHVYIAQPKSADVHADTSVAAQLGTSG
jgi:hypothetical protein